MSNALTIALEVIARGIAPVPIPIGAKNPTRRGWQKLRITAAEAPDYFSGGALNVGALMGPPSSGLADADLDCPEAIKLAPHLLPATRSVYGRRSKRRSHFHYTCNDPDAKAVIKWHDELGKTIIELRLGGGGKGAQSIWPGSVHPSGEVYEWDEDGFRGAYDCAELKEPAARSRSARSWSGIGPGLVAGTMRRWWWVVFSPVPAGMPTLSSAS
jgi:hypothetical protein